MIIIILSTKWAPIPPLWVNPRSCWNPIFTFLIEDEGETSEVGMVYYTWLSSCPSVLRWGRADCHFELNMMEHYLQTWMVLMPLKSILPVVVWGDPHTCILWIWSKSCPEIGWFRLQSGNGSKCLWRPFNRGLWVFHPKGEGLEGETQLRMLSVAWKPRSAS